MIANTLLSTHTIHKRVTWQRREKMLPREFYNKKPHPSCSELYSRAHVKQWNKPSFLFYGSIDQNTAANLVVFNFNVPDKVKRDAKTEFSGSLAAITQPPIYIIS